MPDTTLTLPVSFAQTQTPVGYDYIFAAERIRMALTDKMDMMGTGVVRLVGDLAGSGSDTIRVTHVDGIGWAADLTALASETDTLPELSPVVGYSTVTGGWYGAQHSETYGERILARPDVQGALSVEAVGARMPETWLATFRASVCTTGATIGTAIGAVGTNLSVDDCIDFVNAYNEQDGVETPPVVTWHPVQWSQLGDSARSEPAFQNAVSDFSEVLGTRASRKVPNVLGLGFAANMTSDVTTSGGGFVGFGVQQGGIGYAVSRVSPINSTNPSVYVDQFGLIVEQVGTDADQGIRKVLARAFFGVGLGDDSVFFQRRILSTT